MVAKVTPVVLAEPIDETTQALQAIASLKLPLKRQGSWAWISGAEPQHEAPLKAAGFAWSQKRNAWYFSPKSVQPIQDKALHEGLKVVKALGLSVEFYGAWVWVFGANGTHEAPLRTAGFQWSFKRGLWYFNPKQDKTSSHSQPENGNKIWDYYSGYQSRVV